jgi:hypothetical protein
VFDSKGNHAAFAVDVLVVPGAFQFNSAATQMTGSGMHLRVDGAPGTNGIVLEGSTDLVDWQLIQTNAPIGGTVQFLDASALQSPLKYYRVHQQQ